MKMKEIGWEVQGLEPDPLAYQVARKMGLLVVNSPPLRGTSFPGCYFDAITLCRVIEHLHWPSGGLRVCYRILSWGGIISAIKPNLDSYGHRAFDRNWNHLDPPRHLALFARSSLIAALLGSGFQRIHSPTSTFMNSAFHAASIKQGLVTKPTLRTLCLPYA
jgi:SAM-dependent methyltransferase